MSFNHDLSCAFSRLEYHTVISVVWLLAHLLINHLHHQCSHNSNTDSKSGIKKKECRVIGLYPKHDWLLDLSLVYKQAVVRKPISVYVQRQFWVGVKNLFGRFHN